MSISDQNPEPSQWTGSAPNAAKHLFLVNRITYFGLIVSSCAPVVNFCLAPTWPLPFLPVELSIGLDIFMILGVWIPFSVCWCGGFAIGLVGPCASLVAAIIRVLDCVPALGSSLFVVFTTWLTAKTFTETARYLTAPLVNNLVFFSLIMANRTAADRTFDLDALNRVRRTNFPTFGKTAISYASGVTYSFTDGKCNVTFELAPTQPYTSVCIPTLFVSERFAIAYKNIRDRSISYLRGENLNAFSSSFQIWRNEAKGIRRTLFRRRLLCLLGYAIETAALYFSFVFLNNIDLHPHAGKDEKAIEESLKEFLNDYYNRFEDTAYNAIRKIVPIIFLLFSKDKNTAEASGTELALPVWQILLVVILSFCSHYLHVFMHIESTCTSAAETSSFMLGKVESGSLLDWFWPKPELLRNMTRKWKLLSKREGGEFLAIELPTIGIVAKEPARESGTSLLRNAVTGCDVMVRRISEGVIGLQVVPQEPELIWLCSERVEIKETDTVMFM